MSQQLFGVPMYLGSIKNHQHNIRGLRHSNNLHTVA
jgi:hypothetical protein